MKKTILSIFSVLLIFGVLGFSGGSKMKSSAAYSIPDTKEAKDVMRTVEDAYDITADAAYTFDLKKFPTVFINDSRFPVDSETLETIRQLTKNPSLESAGWLDYKMAYASWMAGSILHAEAVEEKATKENRGLTKEEKQSLTDSQGRTAPARVENPLWKTSVMFKSVEINEDIATVVVDDGPTTVELTLVLIHNQWYIAGSETLSVHP